MLTKKIFFIRFLKGATLFVRLFKNLILVNTSRKCRVAWGIVGHFFWENLKKNILLYTFLKKFLDHRICFSIAEVPVLVLLRYEN